ncbi:MAG: hypothetical protein NXI21_00070 [Alphaproteobacteria bacterium]|nr:hypothetical protein [Alphaproteobacteria bacterium]
MVDQPVPGANAPDVPVAPRPAASLLLVREADRGATLEVLMGRRPDNARFMPGIYVFPGGALDREDAGRASGLLPADAAPPHLLRTAAADEAGGLIWTALRETWEETGLLIGAPADDGGAPTPAPDAPACLAADAYRAASLRPADGGLHYVARAITPPISPIRFDTRFFLVDAAAAHGEPAATGELPEVLWMPVADALASPKVRGVSKFVLRHVLELLAAPQRLSDADRAVPRFTYEGEERVVTME